MPVCRECGHRLGQTAPTCPGCGSETDYARREKWGPLFLKAVVYATFGIVFLLFCLVLIALSGLPLGQ